MHVETGLAARARRFELSPAVFRTLALASVSALYLIIITGTTVRLTSSGLGCESWPGCQQGQPFPEKGYHSFIEFGNRLVGGIVIVTTLLTALAALRAPGLPRYARHTALAVFVGTLAQAPLGYLTVRFDLNPYLVMSHFLLSAVVLAGAVVVAIAAIGAESGAAEPFVPRELRAAATAAAVACLLLLVTGTVATAAGPHPGDSAKIGRLWRLQDAVFSHAVGTAIFGVCFAFMLGYLFSRRDRAPRLLAFSLGVLGVVGVQMAVGAIQYHTRLPWWLVLLHVATAAAVWVGVVALATLFHRPVRFVTTRID
jgi:cytochrome c oxidase assembly protein subunit 15